MASTVGNEKLPPDAGRLQHLGEGITLFVRWVRDLRRYREPVSRLASSPAGGRKSAIQRTRLATIEYRHTVISPQIVNLVRFSYTRTFETDVGTKSDQASALDFFPSRGQNGGVEYHGPVPPLERASTRRLREAQNKFYLGRRDLDARNTASGLADCLAACKPTSINKGGGAVYTFPGLTAFLQGSRV